MEKKEIGLKSIANVLLTEAKALKRANAEIKEVVPEVKKHLAEVRHYSMKIVEMGEVLQKMRIKVDQQPIETLLDEKLNGRQIIKQWQIVAFIAITGIAIVAIIAALYFRSLLQG